MPTKSILTNPDGPHLSESNFRRFELLIERFLSTYPEPFSFTPTDCGSRTAAARLRDAVNAVLHHRFQTPLDLPLLKELWAKVQVSVRGPVVVVGSPSAQTQAALQIASDSRPIRTPLIIHNPSETVLSALIVLLTESAIIDPILLTGSVPSISLPPSIVLEKNPDGSFTML